MGGTDLGVQQEQRTAMDLVLRTMKVTARSLDGAMSTLLVQELHLWLALADDAKSFFKLPNQQFLLAQKQTKAIKGLSSPKYEHSVINQPYLVLHR